MKRPRLQLRRSSELSKISKGTHALVLEELVGRTDGTTAYRYSGLVSEYPSDEPIGVDLVWTAEPDDESDDLAVSVGPGLMAALVLRARTCCEACSGCNRGAL